MINNNLINKKLRLKLDESIKVKKKLFKEENNIAQAIKDIYNCIKNGNKILICGNGGSAADAQHLAAEFLIRLNPKVNRKGFPVITLAMDTSTITACSNDYNFDILFKRNFETFYIQGDILIVLSTSGNSKNIYNALISCKKLKGKSIGFYGNKGGICKKVTSCSIVVDSSNTARIQESHIFLGHFIFNEVEKLLLK